MQQPDGVSQNAVAAESRPLTATHVSSADAFIILIATTNSSLMKFNYALVAIFSTSQEFR
jgi:hypothetical protein